METVRIGAVEARVRACASTLLYYAAEFDRDAMADLVMLQAGLKSGLPSGIIALRLAWAMAKTVAASEGKDGFKGFEEWARAVGALSGVEWVRAVSRVANDGLFLGAQEQERQEGEQGQ